MNSRKKSNRTLYLIITLAVLVAARVILSFFSNQTNQLPLEKKSNNTSSEEMLSSTSTPVESKLPTSELEKMENDCTRVKSQYADLNEVFKTHKLETLFLNIHKEIDNKVYRLRFFYKDGDNAEIPTYLVYEENENEDELIIENTAHEKGPLYKRIEAARGKILFTGSAYDLIGDQDIFLYYENDSLKDLQGSIVLPESDLTHLECRY